MFGSTINHLKNSTEEKFKKIGLLPAYTEITLYLISITFLLLFIINIEFQKEFLEIFQEAPVLFIFIIIGMVASVYNAFKNRIISMVEKDVIIITITFINIFVAVNTLKYLSGEEAQAWLFVFPYLNFLSGMFLMFLLRFMPTKSSDGLVKKLIGDTQSKKEETILGTITTTTILLISQCVFNHYWIITYSICLFYATSLVGLNKKIIILKFFKKNKKRVKNDERKNLS